MGGILQVLKDYAERKGVSSLSDALLKGVQSGEYTLEKQGRTSALLKNLLRSHERESAQQAATLISPVLREAEYIATDPIRHAEYYQQRTTGKLASDPRVARASSQLALLDSSLYDMYVKAGYKVAPRLQGPHFVEKYPREMFEKGSKLHDEAINLLIAKRGVTRDKAIRLLEQHNPNIFQNPIHGRYHPIESRRSLDLPELARKDVAVDLEHIVGAVKRFNEIKYFGQNGEKADFIFKAIRAESGVTAENYARGIYSTFMGHNSNAFPGKAEAVISSTEIATHLGLAVFSHPAKTIESAFIGGLVPFLKGLSEAFVDHDDFMEFGLRSGAALQDANVLIRRLAREDMEGLGSKVLRYTGFAKVIDFQEHLHAAVGKHAAIAEYSNLLENPKDSLTRIRLKSLGIDPDEVLERGLNEQDLLNAGYKMAKIVLGGRNVLDLPSVWRDNWAGRMLTMFKPFFFNQAKFLKNYVIKPALRSEGRDLRPLLYAAIVYPAVGEAVADLKYFVRGKQQDERPDFNKYPYDRVVENISQVGGFGVASDVFSAITTGTPTTTYQLLTGPVVGDVVDLFQFLNPSTSRETHERAILRRIPTIGPAVSRLLVPAKHRKKGKLESGVITKTVEKAEEMFK